MKEKTKEWKGTEGKERERREKKGRKEKTREGKGRKVKGKNGGDKVSKKKERKGKGSVQKLQLFVESFKNKTGSLLFPLCSPFFPQKTSKLLKFFLFLCDVKPRVSLLLLKKRKEERK